MYVHLILESATELMTLYEAGKKKKRKSNYIV